MRLYSRTGATTLDDPEYGHFDVNAEGGFDLPEDLGERLRRFHVDKQPLWETDIERQERLLAEEMERRRDPATLQALVEQLLRGQSTPVQAPAPAPAAKSTSKARKAASPAPPAE